MNRTGYLLSLALLLLVAGGCGSADTTTLVQNENMQIVISTDKKHIAADGHESATLTISAVRLPDRSAVTNAPATFTTNRGEIFTEDDRPLTSNGQSSDGNFFLNFPAATTVKLRSSATGTALVSVTINGTTASLEVRANITPPLAAAHMDFDTGATYNLLTDTSPLPMHKFYHAQSAELRAFREDGYPVPDHTRFDLFVTDTVLVSGNADVSTGDITDSSQGFSTLGVGGSAIRQGDILLLPDAPPADRIRFIAADPDTGNDSQLTVARPYTQAYASQRYLVVASRLGSEIYGIDGSDKLPPGQTDGSQAGSSAFIYQYHRNYLDRGCLDGGGNLPADPSERVYILALSQDIYQHGFISADGLFCFAP